MTFDGDVYVQSLGWASFRTKPLGLSQKTFRLIRSESFPDLPNDIAQIKAGLQATRQEVIDLLDGQGASLPDGRKARVQGEVVQLTIVSPVDYIRYDDLRIEGEQA